MAGEFTACGATVTLLCAGAPPTPPAGVAVRTIDCGGGSKRARTRRFIAAADAFLQSAGFDIVHAVTPCRSCDVYQPRGGVYRETIERTLAVIRNPLLRAVKRFGRRLNLRQQMLMRLEEEILAREAPPFIAAVSELVRSQILALRADFPAERLRVVFNGVSITPMTPQERAQRRSAVRARLGISLDDRVVLFLAHNFRLKGLGELLRALATPGVRAAQALLLVAGRDRPQRYSRAARALGIDAAVRFIGAATPARDLFAAADLLAHPTWYDPCSRVVLEALCCGAPVVTTRRNGAAEAIVNNETGVMVESPADVPRLAAALATALAPEFRSRTRERAEAACAQFSMRRHARELMQFYAAVLERRASPCREK